LKNKIINWIQNPAYIYWIYAIVSVLSAISKYIRGPQAYNNYLIFKNVFYHTLSRKSLFEEYPQEYFDVNHYGIFFSLIIAPFAVLPDWLGMVLWNLCNALLFVFAISKLPFKSSYKAFFAWLCLQEFITSSLSIQFNVALTGLILLSAIYIYEKKEYLSAGSILLGTFVKVYGIVGLSSFFFIKDKKKFILGFTAIAGIFFLAPYLLSNFSFNIHSYVEWYGSLLEKNGINQDLNSYQDISVMGMFRRLLGNPNISNLYFYAIGLPIFMLPYIRVSQYKYFAFRIMILASTLVFLVLFSSSSESPTYIIAVSGVMLWYLIQKNKKGWALFLLVFVLYITCFSMSDLFPRSWKEDYIIKYSLKALPCVAVWCRISYELLIRNFEIDYCI